MPGTTLHRLAYVLHPDFVEEVSLPEGNPPWLAALNTEVVLNKETLNKLVELENFLLLPHQDGWLAAELRLRGQENDKVRLLLANHFTSKELITWQTQKSDNDATNARKRKNTSTSRRPPKGGDSQDFKGAFQASPHAKRARTVDVSSPSQRQQRTPFITSYMSAKQQDTATTRDTKSAHASTATSSTGRFRSINAPTETRRRVQDLNPLPRRIPDLVGDNKLWNASTPLWYISFRTNLDKFYPEEVVGGDSTRFECRICDINVAILDHDDAMEVVMAHFKRPAHIRVVISALGKSSLGVDPASLKRLKARLAVAEVEENFRKVAKESLDGFGNVKSSSVRGFVAFQSLALHAKRSDDFSGDTMVYDDGQKRKIESQQDRGNDGITEEPSTHSLLSRLQALEKKLSAIQDANDKKREDVTETLEKGTEAL